MTVHSITKHTISSPNIIVDIDSRGGSITSLRTQNPDTELMGQWPSSLGGMTSGFVMAPVISSVSDSGKVLHQGSIFEPGKHGYARNTLFSKREKTGNIVILEHIHDPQKSPGIYPFHHRIEIEYAVYGRELMTKLSVLNTGDETMYFGAGLHPAFKWPLPGSSAKDNHSLHLSPNLPEGTLTYRPVDGKICANAIRANPFGQVDGWHIKPDDFHNGAFFFIQPHGSLPNMLTYKDGNGAPRLRMLMEGWDGFGIWSLPDKAHQFICVEPLAGVSVTDKATPMPDIKDVKGLRQLQPGESFTARMHILVL